MFGSSLLPAVLCVAWCCGEEILKPLRVCPGGQTSPLSVGIYRAGSHIKEKSKEALLNSFEIQRNKNIWETQKTLKQVTVGSVPVGTRHQQYQEEEIPGKAAQAAGLQTALPGVTGCPYPCHLSPQTSDPFGRERRKQPQAQAGIQGALPVCSQRQRLVQLHCEAERQLFCCLYFSF